MEREAARLAENYRRSTAKIMASVSAATSQCSRPNMTWPTRATGGAGRSAGGSNGDTQLVSANVLLTGRVTRNTEGYQIAARLTDVGTRPPVRGPV